MFFWPWICSENSRLRLLFLLPCIPICRSESSKETGVTVMTTGYYYCIIVFLNVDFCLLMAAAFHRMSSVSLHDNPAFVFCYTESCSCRACLRGTCQPKVYGGPKIKYDSLVVNWALARTIATMIPSTSAKCKFPWDTKN